MKCSIQSTSCRTSAFKSTNNCKRVSSRSPTTPISCGLITVIDADDSDTRTVVRPYSHRQSLRHLCGWIAWMNEEHWTLGCLWVGDVLLGLRVRDIVTLTRWWLVPLTINAFVLSMRMNWHKFTKLFNAVIMSNNNNHNYNQF